MNTPTKRGLIGLASILRKEGRKEGQEKKFGQKFVGAGVRSSQRLRTKFVSIIVNDCNFCPRVVVQQFDQSRNRTVITSSGTKKVVGCNRLYTEKFGRSRGDKRHLKEKKTETTRS